MAEWEDWENEAEVVAPPKVVAPSSTAAAPTKGAAVLQAAATYDRSKFEGEDEELEQEKQHDIPSSQPKKDKKVVGSDKERMGLHQDETLSDPLAEKMRQQRLVEQSDLMSARDLFGTSGSGSMSALDTMVCKTKEDYEKYGELVSKTYLCHYQQHPGAHYKPMMKSLLKAALAGSSAGELKDMALFVAKLQEDKAAQEAAAKAASLPAAKKAAATKKTLNLGNKSGVSAGLDEYLYADADNGDDYDFM